jgi:sugar phosphate permease
MLSDLWRFLSETFWLIVMDKSDSPELMPILLVRLGLIILGLSFSITIGVYCARLCGWLSLKAKGKS